MRTSALLLLLLSLPAAAGRFDRFNSRTPQGRSTRGFMGTSLAQFEAFNLISTNWCTTDPIVGARGEALTGTRATVGTCTKGVDGLRSTNIADGDLVSLGVNVMRAEADADGYLGLLVEGAASPITIQSRPICNAAWADVGTPDCTADVTTGPWGTTTMARLTDNAAGAAEGRAQTMATTSATRFTAYCYLKGGTATSATFNLLGTGNAAGDCGTTITGLSTTTSSIVSCTSAVAYTAAVTAVQVMIRVGTVVADQGTLFVEGCNVVPSATYRTSFTDAAAVTVARGAETQADFAGVSVSGFAATGCAAATVTPASGSATGNQAYVVLGTNARPLYSSGGERVRMYDGTTILDVAASEVANGRYLSRWSGASMTIEKFGGAPTATGAFDGTMTGGLLQVGVSGAAGLASPGAFILSRIQLDPSLTRCR